MSDNPNCWPILSANKIGKQKSVTCCGKAADFDIHERTFSMLLILSTNFLYIIQQIMLP